MSVFSYIYGIGIALVIAWCVLQGTKTHYALAAMLFCFLFHNYADAIISAIKEFRP